jgi:hypothetical protein
MPATETRNTYLRGFTDQELQDELERRVQAAMIPESFEFIYYLHNTYNVGEFMDYIEDSTDWGISEELARVAIGAFYEVALSCRMDTKTGKVTILGVV